MVCFTLTLQRIKVQIGDRLHYKAACRLPGTAYLFNPQTPCKISVSETFHLKPTKKPLRYSLRANPTKSSISPLFTTPKITTISPKNTIFNNKTTSYKPPKIQSQNLTNTSKINTFTLQHKSKFHLSIEVQKIYHITNHIMTTIKIPTYLQFKQRIYKHSNQQQLIKIFKSN